MALVGAGLLCGSAAAADLREISSAHCRVVYPRGSGDRATVVLNATSEILRELHERLGLWIDEKVTIRLTVDAEEYRQATAGLVPEWSSAAAMPGQRKIVLRAELTGVGLPGRILQTLRHELCHVVLWEAEREAGTRLPAWFHEGVASWFGARPFQDPQPFLIAAASGSLIPFGELEDSFPEGRARARLAYLQSEYFIRFLIREHSREVLRWWLDAFRESGDFEDAARIAIGEDLRRVQARWSDAYRRRFPWLYALWEATTLFGVLAIALIAVYFVRRARARRVHEQWDREDWVLGRSQEDGANWRVVRGEEEEDDPWE